MQEHNKVVELHRQEFAKHYTQVTQSLSAYWMGIIPRAYMPVLQFIVERTLRWGKHKEGIPYRHFMEGVYSNGALIQARVPCSRRSIMYATQWLAYQGFIKITRTKTTDRGWESNLFEINFNLINQRDRSMLKTPKRLKTPLVQTGHKACAKENQALCKPDTLNVHKGNVQKGKVQHLPGTRKPVPGLARDADPREIVASINNKKAVRRSAKIEKAKAEARLTPDAVRGAWQNAMLKTYPSVPVTGFTEKTFGILKKGFEFNFKSVADFLTFIGWVVENWQTLRAGKLSWLNKKEEKMGRAPEIDTVVFFLRTFAKAYAEHVAGEDINEQRKSGNRGSIEVVVDAATQAENKRLEEDNARLNQKVARLSRIPVSSVVKGPGLTAEALADAERLYREE